MRIHPTSLALLLACLGSAGCIAFASPPLRAELTSGAGSNQRRFFGLSLGTSTDAFLPRQLPLDLGAGLALEFVGERESDIVALVGRGPYLELRRLTPCRERRRASIGGRGELLFAELGPQRAVGGKVALRAGGESCIRAARSTNTIDNEPGRDVSIHSIGAGIGALSIGFFLEAGVAVAPQGGTAPLLGFGASIQLPAMAGISTFSF